MGRKNGSSDTHISFNGDNLVKCLDRRRLNIRDVSKAIGYSDNYLYVCCHRNRISTVAQERIEKKFRLSLDTEITGNKNSVSRANPLFDLSKQVSNGNETLQITVSLGAKELKSFIKECVLEAFKEL